MSAPHPLLPRLLVQCIDGVCVCVYLYLYLCVCVCSDGGGGVTTEGHREDYCGVYLNAFNDQSLTGVTSYSMCETEVEPSLCSAGWAHYLDDGSEGTDSCLQLSSYFVANWAQASTACPSGSHLLTVGSTGPSFTLLTYATSLYDVGTLSMYIGCSQPNTAGSTTSGWSWVDSTSASNLNCGSAGCGIWNSGQPTR